jgi:hypothetical protein
MRNPKTTDVAKAVFLGWLVLGSNGIVAAQPLPKPSPKIIPPHPVVPGPRPAPNPPPGPRSWPGDGDLNFDFNFDFDFNHLFELPFALQLPPAPPSAFTHPQPPSPVDVFPERRDLYDRARDSIDRGQYERAIALLDQWLDKFSGKLATRANRVDGALYWKAYTQTKQRQLADALTTLGDLQKRFADSRWIRDAKALEVEIRQASGQAVAPDTQPDEELKLLALRGIMEVDPERALTMIEQLMRGDSSVKVKEQALFLLSQSRLPRGRDIISGVAKGGANPDLQLRAVRYLGAMGGAENRQILEDVYKSTADLAVKRAVIRSFKTSDDRARLAVLAKSESSPELRSEAIRQLGAMRATNELADLYAAESSPDIKMRIIQSLSNGRDIERLLALAKTEKDEQLRRSAIRNLSVLSADRTSDALRSLYDAEANRNIKVEIVNALFMQRNGATLVQMARAEKDTELKREIVQRLSMMRQSKEAMDYLMELLK